MTKQVYTLGYTGRKLDGLKAIVQEKQAILFDIRFSPRSRNPVWNGGNLRQAFGARYKHIRALGNANYRGNSVRIQDFDAGLRAIAESGRPVILMCACKDYGSCHRSVIATRLRELGYVVTEISTKPEPMQRTLF
jgi:uncharacterized protein (DUF488 family)